MLLLLSSSCARDPEIPPSVDPTTTVTWGSTATVPGCPTIADVTVEASPGNLLERRIRVDLDAPGSVFAICTAEDQPEELHLAESAEEGERHDLAIRGLLGSVAYRCEIRSACGGPTVGAGFTPSPVPLPPFEVTSEGEGPSSPYTLLNTQLEAYTTSGAWLLIVDPEGRPRWGYRIGEDLVADIDAELEDGGTTVHLGGGWAYFDFDQPNRGVFRDVDLSGEVLLDHPEPVFGIGFNHHSEKLDDGSYLSLTGSENRLGPWEWYGVGIERWHPERGLLWTWSTQQLVDQGVLGPPGEDERTPYHSNSVSLVEDALGEGAWVSLYKAKQLWRLDRQTGDRTHVFGQGGDLALLDPEGRPLPEEEWPWVQHDPDWAPDGRVLMYDNGQGRPGESLYSRVVEYRVDLAARTATRLWSWTEPGWYDPVLGDADYLPSGNVLVTRGFNDRWTPNRDDVSQVVELVPPDRVVWRLRWTSRYWTTFRAQRYGGCEVFANARYCPEVAERAEELLRGAGVDR